YGRSDNKRLRHIVFQGVIEKHILKGNTRRKSPVILIDDSGIRRVARAICDPHKETGRAAAIRVPAV
ncbi:hypothetical protein HispidOSU_002470, partial [Sigmodon hispidus]